MADANESDDYVTELLKKDAKESSSQYRSLGIGAFLPKRPTTQAPKPNTRFLKHILRETDSHNAALLAKEAGESRARLRAMQRGTAGRGREKKVAESGRPDRTSDRGRKRRYDDDDPIEPKRTKVRSDEREGKRPHRYHRHRSSSRSDESRSRSRTREDTRHRRRHRRRSPTCSEESKTRSRSPDGRRRRHAATDDDKPRHRSSREHKGRRNRSRSPDRRDHSERARSRSPKHGSSRRHRDKRSRSRSRTRSGSRTRVPRKESRRSSRREYGEGYDEKRRRKRVGEDVNHHRSPSAGRAAESDPLEDIVGPLLPPPEPKVRTRGRGKISSSAMDAHFDANYDPSADVQPDSDVAEEWDQAVEAFRDRQKWKQQGADRLREAGFTEDEVKKWEKGGEKTEEDVRWAKQGEGREWDRGKVVSVDGQHIEQKAEWGRLKGT
ncbi:hypothetical protein P152DRAFT_441026 [Eremomyces bilateralis CBS 781.70]|uniref:Uncharacterized protein n=1 Tax=Eremomyces bilateralis CBS 781.70 TaxID=1392243 RepID=A0A6G1FW86_9PEZI|nr:uncharacterized protein P152DRAFT_441026 [Eremomyces bilateralis CBS 781.70]KAF1809956.1 hypothetical protein P152DRAFT_441026 [Eremomyces bilateralis CBS 781.70]